MQLADRHNFGECVLNTGALFLKPRTVFWEWFFFDRLSPLASALENTLFFENVFGLEIAFSSAFHGGSSRRIEPLAPSNSDSLQRNFGLLLSYCYTFGILDLHDENIVLVRNKLQVIDAEIVLSKLLLPEETLLLPFKDIQFSDTGSRYILDEISNTTLKQFENIVAAFIEGIEQIDRCRDEILGAFLKVQEKALKQPIRIIFRNTKKYQNFRSRVLEPPLFREEIEQLERGDIPYFFKYLESDEVHFYKDKEKTIGIVNLPDSFLEAAKRIGRSPSELLDYERIHKEVLSVGVLSLCRKLLLNHPSGTIIGNNWKITFSKESLNFQHSWGTFHAHRRRPVPQAV